ncbi:MAG: hypothetical protein ABI597_13670, partial [Gammaproteobacteria bacterium]
DNLNEFNSAVPEKKAAKSEKVQSEIDFSDEEAHFMQLLQKDFYHKLLLETKYLGFGDDLSVTISSKSTELMPIAGMAVARDREPYKYNAKKLDTALSHETALAYITQPQAQGIPPLIKILIILGFQTNNVSTFLSKREIPGLYASVRLEKTITPAELKLSNDYFDDRRSALITTLCDLGMASVLADICADYSAPTPELKELYDDNPIRKLPSAIQGKDSALFIKILNDVIKSWIDYFPILKSKLIVKASEEGFFDLVVQYIKTYPALRKVVEDTSEARQEFANTLIEKAIKAKDKIAEEYFKNHPLAFGLFSPWQFSHKQSNTNASTVAPQQHTKQRISKSGKF